MMPEVQEITGEDLSGFGVAIEGDGSSELPAFDSINNRRAYIDVFRCGSRPVDFKVNADVPWVQVKREPVGDDFRLWVAIDWATAPEGESRGNIMISDGSHSETVQVRAIRATDIQERDAKGCFGGLIGPIAMNASDAVVNMPAGNVRWEAIPDYGRVAAAMSIFPATAESVLPPQNAPVLEYPAYIAESGAVSVDVIIGSTLNFVPGRGLRLAVSFDDETPQVVDAFPTVPEAYNSWADSVRDNVRTLSSTHEIRRAGRHTLKIRMVDPGVVLEKIIIHDGPLPKSYFGAPAVSLNQ